MLSVVSAVLLLHPVSSFIISKPVNQITYGTHYLSSSRNTRLYSASEEEVDEDDPYGDLLNFKKPIETENSKDLMNIWSIDSSIDSGSLMKIKGPPKTAQQQWEHWDAFMEEQFGNMDAEVPESERWQFDMRDSVEQKRGKWIKTYTCILIHIQIHVYSYTDILISLKHVSKKLQT